jgi:hypothetical protein
LGSGNMDVFGFIRRVHELASNSTWWGGRHFVLYKIKTTNAGLPQKSIATRRGRDFSPLDRLMKRQYETHGVQSETAAAEAFCLHHAFKRCRAGKSTFTYSKLLKYFYHVNYRLE